MNLKTTFEEMYKKGDPWGIKAQPFDRRRVNAIKSLLSAIELNSNSLCLDAGCGEGMITHEIFKSLKKLNFTGLDISRTALKRAKNLNFYRKLIEGDCSNLPFKDNSFDLALLLETIYYLNDWGGCLIEAKRVLKIRGLVLVGVALGRKYLNWREFIEIFANHFTILDKRIIRYPFWFIKLDHYGKGIVLGEKL